MRVEIRERREHLKNVDSVQQSRVRIPQFKKYYPALEITSVTHNETSLGVGGIAYWRIV